MVPPPLVSVIPPGMLFAGIRLLYLTGGAVRHLVEDEDAGPFVPGKIFSRDAPQFRNVDAPFLIGLAQIARVETSVLKRSGPILPVTLRVSLMILLPCLGSAVSKRMPLGGHLIIPTGRYVTYRLVGLLYMALFSCQEKTLSELSESCPLINREISFSRKPQRGNPEEP
jgi:hypothetical protein